MIFYVKYGLSDIENDVKFSKLSGTEIREVDEKRCPTGELAKYEFVGFYIRLEDVKTHVSEILLLYAYLFIYLFIFEEQVQGVRAEKYI
jgi:hypothetical protein